MSENEKSDFLKRVYELGKVKDVSEAFKEFDPKEEIHKGDPNFFVKNDDIESLKDKSEKIENLIYTIRGKQVILDSDVAVLYGTETKKINQAVKRNIERFPEKFCFQLTENEMLNLRSQIVTASESEKVKFRNNRYMPYAFTEQGIVMISVLLRSEIAVEMSIKIVEAFVKMRNFLISNGPILERLSNVEYKLINQDKKMLEYDKNFNKVFNELQKNKKEEFKEKIFYNGQIYDAYSLIIDIIKRATKKILIIDNYIDDSILKMLAKKNKNVKVVILTSNNSNILELDVNKFNEEYPILEIAKINKFHDRFIVIDNKELYHVGASLKDAGKKWFAISKIEDFGYIEKINNITQI